MKTLEITIEIGSKNQDYVSIVHCGDEHVGNSAVDESLMRRVVSRIDGDPLCYWINTGDRLDLIMRSDPRFEDGKLPAWFSFDMMKDPPKHQIARYREIFKPIADRCLASVEGNHEHTIIKHYQRDVYSELDTVLGLPEERRLGTSGFLRLRFISCGKVVWRPVIFLHHGAGAGRKKASAISRLEELPSSYEATVYCVGHTHKKVAASSEIVAMSDNGKGYVRRRIIFSNTGSFMPGVSPVRDAQYNERGLLYPQDVGPVELRFYPILKEVKVVL